MTTKYFLIISIILSTCLTACQATPKKPSVEEKEAMSLPYSPPPSPAPALTIPPASGVPTLYAILIADTRDRNIGISTKIDLDKLKILVENISKQTQLPNRQLIIQGDQMSRQTVVNTLTQLPITSQDLVIFYYSGHGTRGRLSEQRESKWPYLCVDGIVRCQEQANRLDLDYVVDTLTQKGPRFFLAFADACNDLIPGRKDKPILPVITHNPDSYRKLFLEPSGYHIIASGSKPGQVSIGDDVVGGKFTHQFLNSLRHELAADYPANWDTVMQRAIEPISYPTKKGENFVENIQQPQFEFHPHDVASQSSPTPIPPNPDPLPLPVPDPSPVHSEEIHLEILPSPRLRPGDAVQFALTTPRPGYLFIFDAEHNTGGRLSLVFPNSVYQQRSQQPHFRLSAKQRFLWPDERYFELNTRISAPSESGPRSLVALLITDDQALNQIQEVVGKPVNTLTDWLTQRLGKDRWVMTMTNYEIVQ